MRMIRKLQMSLFGQWPDHKLGQELKKISEILDRHPEFAEWVHADLSKGKEMTGDVGMSSEQVLRAAVIKQIRGLSYEGLAFNIADSSSTMAFLMLDLGERYGHSCLQENISQINEETWQLISTALVLDAKDSGIENCKTVRVDSTVTETNIHHPTDSSLLYDCIRVICREFFKARDLANKKSWRLVSKQQVKEAKSLCFKINNAKNDEERLPHYKKLLKLLKGVSGDLPSIIKRIEKEVLKKECLTKPLNQLKNVQFYLEKIIYQTVKRVIKGQKVPSPNKIISIFEPHSDIIVKDSRDTQFGHKVFITSGKSNMVLHCDIPKGNIGDAEVFLPTLASLKTSYDIVPRKTSADGGFSSINNVEEAKDMGVKDVCFPKKCGMEITEMVKSSWVYNNLLNWRAGVEAVISFLKRCFGLRRAMWSGFDGYKKYIRSSVAAYNLVVLARHELK